MVFCRIRVPSKFFTKPYFRINPAGKSKMPSWKNIISQLENYFFPIGKSKFRSRAILNGFLGSFLNYFERFLFILTTMRNLWTRVKMFDIERWVASCELWEFSEGLKAPGYLISRLSDDFSFIDCHSTTYLMIKRYFSKSIPILGERYSLMSLKYRLP